jgi:alpha-1,3-rhamnosyl/mannosyltransferase
LLELLPRLAARTSVVALVDARLPVPDLGVATEAIGAPKGVPRLGWLELGVARWVAGHPGTLLHGAAYALPVRHRGPAVVTLFDVAWASHPRDFGTVKRQVWRVSARRSVARAGAVLTASEFSRQAIVATYDLDPSTVLVAPCAAASIFGPGASVPSRAVQPGRPVAGRLDPLPPRYVVAVGGAPRRNLPLAVEAWRCARRSLRDRGPAGGPDDPEAGRSLALVVVGAERPPEEPELIWLGPVDDATWASVLAGAEALLYPTSYEGFGLPAAEACACGVPVVCARVASLPEVLGDAAAWADRLDAGAFASTLVALLADPGRRAQLSAAGLDRSRQAPTWDDAADTTVEAYDLALRRWAP